MRSTLHDLFTPLAQHTPTEPPAPNDPKQVPTILILAHNLHISLTAIMCRAGHLSNEIQIAYLPYLPVSLQTQPSPAKSRKYVPWLEK